MSPTTSDSDPPLSLSLDDAAAARASLGKSSARALTGKMWAQATKRSYQGTRYHISEHVAGPIMTIRAWDMIDRTSRAPGIRWLGCADQVGLPYTYRTYVRTVRVYEVPDPCAPRQRRWRTLDSKKLEFRRSVSKPWQSGPCSRWLNRALRPEKRTPPVRHARDRRRSWTTLVTGRASHVSVPYASDLGFCSWGSWRGIDLMLLVSHHLPPETFFHPWQGRRRARFSER